MTDLDDKQEYKMPIPIKIPPGPPCPGCKKPVTTFGELRARCMSCGLDFVDALLRPKAQSDREDFKAFFRRKGVHMGRSVSLDEFDEYAIYVSDLEYKFTEQGEFVGVKCGSGPPNFTERLPAPEGG